MKKNVIKFCFGIILLFVLIGVVNAQTNIEQGFGDVLGFNDKNDVVVHGMYIDKGRNFASIFDDAYFTIKREGEEEVKFEHLKEGAKFKFKDEKITEAHYSVTEATSYKIGNIEFFVPKDGKVEFIEGKIIVYVPKGVSINQNVVQKIDRNEKDENYEVIYKPAEGEDTIKVQDVNNPHDLIEIKNFKVGDNDKTDFGIGFRYEENGNKDIFIRGRASINDWYEIGREGLKESIDTYLFFDGEMHRDFNKAYISINSDGTKLSLGNSKGYGPLLGFLPKNPIYPYEKGKKTLMIQPLVGAHMTISKRDGMIPLLETKGFYNIYMGDKALRFAKGENVVKGLEKPSLHKDFGEVIDGYVMKGTESIPLQVKSQRDDGTNLNLDYIISDSREVIGVKIKDWTNRQVYLTQDGQLVSIYDDYMNIALDKDAQKKFQEIIKSKKFQGIRQGIKSQEQLMQLIDKPNKFGIYLSGDIGEMRVQAYTESTNPGHRSKTYNDVYGHAREDSSDVHETYHKLHNEINNDKRFKKTDRDNIFYLLDDKLVRLVEPNGVTMSSVRDYIPQNVKGNFAYNLYMVEQANNYFNNQPLYIMEEYVCYTYGQMFNNDIKSRGSSYMSPHIPSFTIYTLAMGENIRKANPTYWNDPNTGGQLKAFMGFQMERAMNTQRQYESNFGRDSEGRLMDHLRTSNDAGYTRLRNFARETFGSDYTQRVFGFE